MSKPNIHSTAIIEDGAQIGEDVIIEPYAIVKGNVILRDRVVIKSHAYIDGHTEIGEDSIIYPCASIGTKTQDLKYKGERTFVKIGKKCEIREFVTINSSCGEDTSVEIGDNCLIMAYCHVAHNCIVGNHVIMSNNSALAGHVTVEDFAIIGGMTPIHQNVRIGRNAMVGGFSRVGRDIPPYLIGGGTDFKFGGINLVGLKRHNFPLKTRQLLSDAFRLLYRSNLTVEEALHAIETQIEQIPEVQHFVQFCRNTTRGLMVDHVKADEKVEVNA